VSSSRGSILVTGIELAYRIRGVGLQWNGCWRWRPGVAGLPLVAAAPPAACVRLAAADRPGILLGLWYSRAHSLAGIAAARYSCSKVGYRAGSDRGSPNQGSTLASKRVMPQIWPPARVST